MQVVTTAFTKNYTQCLRNQTKQLVANGIFKHTSEMCLSYVCGARKPLGKPQVVSALTHLCCQILLEKQ